MTNGKPSLDDLYKMVANIYSEQNAQRTATATFAHFVEVCGMLTLHDRDKAREALTVDDALCKALGWYFPLLAKFRVSSVEELIFRKYPYACPYCRHAPHRDEDCKRVEGVTSRTVDHAAVREQYDKNARRRPHGLDQWQDMFQAIYPRSLKDRDFSVSGLFEELGELAEAIRVYERFPKYFAGEAADVFSYIMGIANEHRLREKAKKREFSFEAEFIRRYPGLCVQCGNRQCVCPAVPEATVGRMSKELDLGPADSLFRLDPEVFRRQGTEVSAAVLEQLGGFGGLADRFPFDRGETNKALTLFMLRVADAVSTTNEDAAHQLRGAAVRIANSATYPGSRRQTVEGAKIVEAVAPVVKQVGNGLEALFGGNADRLASEIAKMLSRKVRILFVSANPVRTNQLRLADEQRAIKEAIRLSEHRDAIHVEVLAAATVDDLRRAMLKDDYHVVHFSGHGDHAGPIFQDVASQPQPVPMSGLAALFEHYAKTSCVILNACWTLADLTTPIAPFTIGMDAAVGDQAAIEFARGFYDALGAGHGFEKAIEEGTLSVKLKGLEGALPLKVLRK